MKADFIKHAFSAGEVSRTFYGRTDLEQYDLAVAQAVNFFVDYQGGLASRAGLEFVDFLLHDDKELKIFSFQFAPEVADTYLIVMGHKYIRFVQDGRYLLEEAFEIEGLSSDEFPVVRCPGHGYADGDWVRVEDTRGTESLNGQTFVVRVLDGSRFALHPLYHEVVLPPDSPPYAGGGTVARIYTLASPYSSEDLSTLNHHQSRNAVFLTHTSHPPRRLERESATEWELVTIEIGNDLPIPVITGYSATAAKDPANAGVAFSVTAVSTDDEEGLPCPPYLITQIVNYAAERGSVRIDWETLPDVNKYNVYRSILLPRHSDLTRGERMGYLGTVSGTVFVDNNIVPDFTLGPPMQYNPFAGGSIRHINIVDSGAGYSRSAEVTIDDPTGSGFRGWPIVDTTGRVVGVEISRGGQNYTDPTVVFSGNGGSGASAVALMTPRTGNYPAVTTLFQSRRVYAASINQPLTIWGSRAYREDNFDISPVINDGDSYEFDIESPQVTPIKHLIPQRASLLVFSNAGMWQLSGVGGGPVTPTQALAEPQFYQGCSDVPPLSIDSDLLFISERGTTIRLLAYNDVLKAYTGKDVSILANHLFAEDRQITDWVYVQEPYRIVYGVRQDGVMTQFTIVKEQEVYAWSRATTQGYFEQVSSLQENFHDRLYVVVRRFVNGSWRRYLERQTLRNFKHVEDSVCMDSALVLEVNAPEAGLVVDGDILRADSEVFTAEQVGWVFRSAGSKATVVEWLSGTEVRVRWRRPYDTFIPETTIPAPAAAGNWFLDPEVTQVYGLGHLEGMAVSVLADGNVVEGLVVRNGSVTLPEPASRVSVGLGYRCLVQTLPPASMDMVMEHKRKKIFAAYSRVDTTRGLKYGGTLDNLYEVAERSTEDMGEPIRTKSGVQGVLISTDWDINGQAYIVQDNPLPATILGLVLDGDFSDS